MFAKVIVPISSVLINQSSSMLSSSEILEITEKDLKEIEKQHKKSLKQ